MSQLPHFIRRWKARHNRYGLSCGPGERTGDGDRLEGLSKTASAVAERLKKRAYINGCTDNPDTVT